MKTAVYRTYEAESGRAPALTRLVAALLVPFLLAAAGLLMIFPADPARFAWPINPRLTALIMGAGYLSGAYFFSRLALSGNWRAYALGLLPVTAFAWLSGIETLVHWHRFNHEHSAFFAWVALYAVTPFLLPVLWFANRHLWDTGLQDGEARIPPVPRTALWVLGGLIAFTGLLLFLAPQVWAATWPWQISPLTGMVMGSWFILAGLTDVLMGVDGRWGVVRRMLETQLIGLAGIMVAFLRGWSDLDLSNPLAPGFVAFIVLLFLFLTGLYLSMTARSRA